MLVLRCQIGDDQAFEQLYDRFKEPTFRYLSSIVGPGAEDTHQDVWVEVFRHVGRLKNPGSFRTWLFQISRNRAIDALRRQRRESEILVNPSVATHLHSESDREQANSVEQGMDLTVSLKGLSTAHREVVLLRFWEGMSYAQIAQIMSVPVGTVRSRLHHAKEALRGALTSPQAVDQTVLEESK